MADGRRFIAITPEDQVTLEALMADDVVGQPGRVATADGVNFFGSS